MDILLSEFLYACVTAVNSPLQFLMDGEGLHFYQNEKPVRIVRNTIDLPCISSWVKHSVRKYITTYNNRATPENGF